MSSVYEGDKDRNRKRTHINTLLKCHRGREAYDGIGAPAAVLQEIREDVPHLGVVWRRAVARYPFADEPCDAPFDYWVAAAITWKRAEGSLSFPVYNLLLFSFLGRAYLELVSLDSGRSVVSNHCSKGISSLRRVAQRPIAQYIASF